MPTFDAFLSTTYWNNTGKEYLIALGACSCTGCVPAYRNYTLKENYEHLLYKKQKELEDRYLKKVKECELNKFLNSSTLIKEDIKSLFYFP